MEANNLKIKKILIHMGNRMSIEDIKDITESINRNPETYKTVFFLAIFIIVPQLLSYALMNAGR